MGSTSDFGRRDLIKRSAALGLIAVPSIGALSGCASSGGGGSDKVHKGTKSAKNPLAVNESAPLDVVLFDGGFGTDYFKIAESVYEGEFPKTKGKIKQSATQKIQTELQPRFNGGTPPDVIDNSGAEQMDFGTLIGKKQLTDLTALMDAPSIDDPSKKVRDTLRPGVLEMGQFGDKQVWVMYYAYTVYGVWYSKTNLAKLDAEYPKTWDEMLALCAKAKKKGIAGWTYPGKYPYYLPFSLYAFIGKIGGVEVLNAIDNLEPNAWKNPAVKAAFDAYYEIVRKGYMIKGNDSQTHIEAQTDWTEGKALFIPNGSWVENEAKKTTPKNFQMAVGAPSSLDKSDKMPYGTIWAGGGEPFIVPKNAKNPQGGMEMLRVMLGKKASQNFIRKVSSLTSLNGGTEGVKLGPGLTSALSVWEYAAKRNLIVNPRIPDWYVSLEKEQIGVGVLGEMMQGRMTPDEAIKKIQGYADKTAKDDSISKYKHSS